MKTLYKIMAGINFMSVGAGLLMAIVTHHVGLLIMSLANLGFGIFYLDRL